MKEYMSIMGISNTAYWLSWFTYYFIIISIISASCIGILSAHVIVHSNLFLVFLFFWLFGISLFGLIVFIQAFFTKAKLAAIVGTLIYFGIGFVGNIASKYP